MAYTEQQFLEKIKPLVIADMKASGILASLTAAQAFIESGKGNSGLAVKANNLFGMKGEYKDQSVIMSTKEWSATRGYYTIDAAFRKYPSWAESIADHSALFNRLARYTNLRGCKAYRTACWNVQADGYATAPTYSHTLIKTIETYKLYEWDKEAIGEAGEAADSGQEQPQNRNPYNEPTSAIRLNSRGNGVRWLQYELTKRGYGLVIDGIAGDKTIQALKAFQTANNLVVDGIAGPATRKALAGDLES